MHYKQLSIDLIDEGRFVEQLNEDLRKLQQALVKYVQEHQEKAEGAKAVLAITVSLKVEDPSERLFSVKAASKTTVPQRPAIVNMAIGDTNDVDEPALFVRDLGGDKTSPRQGKVFTDDGRPAPQPNNLPPHEEGTDAGDTDV